MKRRRGQGRGDTAGRTCTLSSWSSEEPAASSVWRMIVSASVVCCAMPPASRRAGLAPLASWYQPPIPPMKSRLPERRAPPTAWAVRSGGGVSNAVQLLRLRLSESRRRVQA